MEELDDLFPFGFDEDFPEFLDEESFGVGLDEQYQSPLKPPSVPKSSFNELKFLIPPPPTLNPSPPTLNPPPVVNKPKRIKPINNQQSGGIRVDQVLEKPYSSVFQFQYFNRVQSECFDAIMNHNCNLLVSAPTGSGKTTVLELAIVHLTKLNTLHKIRGKAVYMAPLKALCQEIYTKWNGMFQSIGLKFKELTGDTEFVDFRQISNVDVILTTPEKWDSLTRRWRENTNLLKEIKLLMIDEVHLLNESRGATLEAVVSRMKTISNSCNGNNFPMRFVALSATIPNFNDIAHWLDTPPEGSFRFGEEFRPVKLEKHVLCFKMSKTPYLFDNYLNYKLYEVIQTYSGGKPTLIFCSSRKGASQAAHQLIKDGQSRNQHIFIKNDSHKQRLIMLSSKIQDKNLAECLVRGVGFHSAGIDSRDRRLVEEAFLNQDILALCTTTTLSQGVNLPAHLVIIRGTQMYKPGLGYCEHSELTIVQMMGRAGRPQFDNTGVAVILTSYEQKSRYTNLINNSKDIESSLMQCLAEHLNSEIVLKTITDISMAIQWLKSTYLWQRCQSNPGHYQIPIGLTPMQLESYLKEKLIQVLHELEQYELIEMNDGFEIHSRELGRVMARVCVRFGTMKNMFQITPFDDVGELLLVLGKSEEFSDLRLRVSEKKILNLVNTDPLMHFPIQGKIQSVEAKISCFLQAFWAGIEINDFSLKQEINMVLQAAPRILRALQEYLKEKKLFFPLKACISLQQCCSVKVWNEGNVAPTHTHLRQFSGIGPALAASLASGNIKTVEALRTQEPTRLEFLCKKNSPFGFELLKQCAKLPHFMVSLVSNENENGQTIINLKVDLLNIPKTSIYFHTVIMAGNDKGKLLYWKRIQTNSISEVIKGVFPLNPQDRNEGIFVEVMNEELMGCDARFELPLFQSPYFIGSFPQYSSIQDSNDKDPFLPVEQNNWKDIGDTPVESTSNSRKRKVGLCKHQCKDKKKCKHACCKRLLYSPQLNSEPGKESEEEEEIELDSNQPTLVTYFQKANQNPPKTNQISIPFKTIHQDSKNGNDYPILPHSLKGIKEQVKRVENSTFLNPERPPKRLKSTNSPPLQSTFFSQTPQRNYVPFSTFPQNGNHLPLSKIHTTPRPSHIPQNRQTFPDPKNITSIRLNEMNQSLTSNQIRGNEFQLGSSNPFFFNDTKKKPSFPSTNLGLSSFYSKIQKQQLSPISQFPKSDLIPNTLKENEQELDFSDLFN